MGAVVSHGDELEEGEVEEEAGSAINTGVPIKSRDAGGKIIYTIDELMAYVRTYDCLVVLHCTSKKNKINPRVALCQCCSFCNIARWLIAEGSMFAALCDYVIMCGGASVRRCDGVHPGCAALSTVCAVSAQI